jgi:hypothetical protein
VRFFSPVAKSTSIIVLMSLVTALDLEMEQMDVMTIFLHGDLEEEIYFKTAYWICSKGKEIVNVQVEKIPLLSKAITKDVVLEV